MKTIHIIGGGVLGFTTAFYLATSDFASQIRIKLYDQSQVGKESSWAGAGLLCPLMFWNYPNELNHQILSSLAEYPNFVEKLQYYSSIDPELDQLGLTIYDLEDEHLALNWLHQFNYNYQYDSTQKQLLLPDVYLVRNPRLIQSLVQACLNLNVEIIEQKAFSQENFYHSTSNNQDDLYIITAGAWTQQLLPNFKIYPMKGQILLFKTPERCLNTAIYKAGKYIVPRRDGHILVGSSLENVGFDKSTTKSMYQELFDFSHEFINQYNPELIQQWAGLRPASDAVMPFIEQVESNIFINAGHFRYGVTQAPASAIKMRNLIYSNL